MTLKKKVFIADDEPAIVFNLKNLLALEGFEVEATSNPSEVIERVRAFSPDIVLLDLLMPKLGGLEVCAMLNNDERLGGIPVIIISALTGYTDIKRAYQLGVVGYIAKPYDFKVLTEKINLAIARKESI